MPRPHSDILKRQAEENALHTKLSVAFLYHLALKRQAYDTDTQAEKLSMNIQNFLLDIAKALDIKIVVVKPGAKKQRLKTIDEVCKAPKGSFRKTLRKKSVDQWKSLAERKNDRFRVRCSVCGLVSTHQNKTHAIVSAQKHACDAVFECEKVEVLDAEQAVIWTKQASPENILTIDRKLWSRGGMMRGNDGRRYLLRDGLLDCLGFECLRRGLHKSELHRVATPMTIRATKKNLPHLKVVLKDIVDYHEPDYHDDPCDFGALDTSWATTAMEINDAAYITDKQREARLKAHFKKIGVKVNFIN